MGDDVGEEITFSAIFPLPFRVLALAGLGILAWATNLHGLSLAGVDASSVMSLDPRSGPTSHDRRDEPPLPTRHRDGWKMVPSTPLIYGPLYRLFLQYSILCVGGWFLFRHASAGSLTLVDVFKYIPAAVGLLSVMVLVSPSYAFARHERDAFLHTIHRCLFSPTDQQVYFSDVIFADVFTSYAKVIGDIWLSWCMLLPSGSLLVQPQHVGWSRWILPTLMSLPYAVRFRQCLIEYRLSGKGSRRPIFNAIKYASAFPVIYLSAAQRIAGSGTSSVGIVGPEWHGRHYLFRFWLLAVAVNSLYSFWWDVTHDWGFDLLSRTSGPTVGKDHPRSPPKRLLLPRKHSLSSDSNEDLPGHLPIDQESWSSQEARQYPFGLRPTLLFPLPVYPFAIAVDLVLRLTWSVKLSSHLHSKTEGDLLIFWIEMAELIRRWMWVFIRVEWELARQRGDNRSRRPSHDEIDMTELPPSGTGGITSSPQRKLSLA